jgi:hypothetical protein
MNLSFSFIFLLALADLLQASPIPQNSDPPPPQKKWITWRTWIPFAGAAAFLGSLATFVYLGTNSEESYKSAQSAQLDQKLSTLSPKEQDYLHIYLGKKTEGEKAEMRNKKENARILTLNAQREAAVIIATDLKKAWEKAGLTNPLPAPPAPPEPVESQ